MEAIHIGGDVPSNDAKAAIESEIPFVVEVVAQGVADYLYHRWSVEAVEAKSRAKKGSVAKNTDNLESYVYRTADGQLAIPGAQLRGAMLVAAKFRQDPRSPRKSAQDLFKAGVFCLTQLASVGQSSWDYEDRQRVNVRGSSITRTRPALKAGWTAKFQLQCNLPDYINPALLHDVLEQAGRLVGLGDYRPTYGRFQIVRFALVDLS